MARSTFVLLSIALVVAAPVMAFADDPSRDAPIRRSAAAAVQRLNTAAARTGTSLPAQPAHRNGFQRHPVWTAALVGGGSGFLIGYLPGDDVVFDDFTAEFNGAVVAGIGAGVGAALIKGIQAIRR
ncbi:MAG: hypothetical protein ABIT71_23010 [Vicinamibacteraceae bacterium]